MHPFPYRRRCLETSKYYGLLFPSSPFFQENTFDLESYERYKPQSYKLGSAILSCNLIESYFMAVTSNFLYFMAVKYELEYIK